MGFLKVFRKVFVSIARKHYFRINKKTKARTIKRQHQKYSYRTNALVATLEKKGIKNQKVLQAIETVPRHSFVDSALVNRAYDDRALPIDCSQTISQDRKSVV